MDREREWIGVFPELVSNRRRADTAPKAEPGITGCGTPVGGMDYYGSRVTKDKRQTGMNGTAKSIRSAEPGRGGTMITETKI